MGLSRRTLFCGFGALALGGLGRSLFLASRSPRLPLPPEHTVLGWLGNDALLVVPYGHPDTPKPYDPFAPWDHSQDAFIFDLKTQTRHALPPLPPLPPFAREKPLPSPDGRWVLYKEKEGGGSKKDAKPYATRWRLVRVDGSETRMFPPDGSFRPAPNEAGFPLPPAVWFPDSSGWMELTQLSSGACSLQRYDLAAQAPRALPPPSLKPGFTLKQLLPNGQAVFAHQTEFELVPLFPGAPPAAHHKLALPPGSGNYSFLAYTPEALLVSSYYTIKRKEPVRWIASRLKMEDEFCEVWRIPLRGGAPQKLVTLPHDAHNFTLTHDQKHLLYWEPNGEAIAAYALALP